MSVEDKLAIQEALARYASMVVNTACGKCWEHSTQRNIAGCYPVFPVQGVQWKTWANVLYYEYGFYY